MVNESRRIPSPDSCLLTPSLVLIAVGLCMATGASGEPGAQATAALIGSSSGLPGGLCIVLDRRDADLAIAMSKQGKFTVQALCPDKALLDSVRKAIRSGGVYGTVSADLWGSDPARCARLPYAENLVTLLVADNYADLKASGLSTAEILRVLAPLGAAYLGDSRSSDGEGAAWVKDLVSELRSAGVEDVKVLAEAVPPRAGTWVKAVKPWPGDIDEWTHYLHGADGNPVARDRVVGPPKHYQWISQPTWLISHETDSSIGTLATSRSRLFYIINEAPISLCGDHPLPDKWAVAARDAFNGVFLWKVPIPKWGWREWKNIWFTNRPGDIPLNIQKRLVATGDRVYVTLGYRAPVSQLDAKTGNVLKTYDGTDRTSEILCCDGTLVLAVLTDDGLKVMAVDTQTGRKTWTTEKSYGGTTTDYIKWTAMNGSVEPQKLDPTLSIATDGKVVALLDGMDVVGLDFKTGKEIWRTRFPDEGEALYAGGMKLDALWVGTTIVQDNAVLHASPNRLICLAADTGKVKWSQPKKYIGHLWYEWKDVFVINGLVWTWGVEFAQGAYESGKKKYKTNAPTTVNGYDLHTGEIKKTVPLGSIFKTYHHHRCYRNKATLRYILASRRGTEYVDLEQGKHTVDNWVRGTCHVGMMPANGLQYVPPHPCVCYIDEKLNGMNALAPEIPPRYTNANAERGPRLERGPAYGQIQNQQSKIQNPDDWPAFRHDAMRTGSTSAKLPEKLKPIWSVKAGSKVGPPIVVSDKVFVPLVDEHHIAALSASDGSKSWEFAAGGRIDSPPTCHQGALLFGSTDGWVYCVRASDGALVWRFRGAPEDRRIGAFDQIESAWPIHGSVLVQRGVAYFAAGRSSHLDGGIYLYGIDAATGELRCQANLQGPSYTVDNITENYKLPMGALPDILMGDDTLVYMRNRTFDAKLQEAKGAPELRVRSGFLDDSYFKRAPWTFGHGSNYGRLIVYDDQAVYIVRMFDTLRGLDPTVYFTPGKNGYLLIAESKVGPSQIKVANSKSLNVPNKPLTVEAWVKAEAPDGAIVAKGGSSVGYALVLKDGKPRFDIRVGGKVESAAADEDIVGRWAHLVGRVTENKDLELFVNGKCAGRGKASAFAGPSGQAMEIGADLGSGVGDYESPFNFTGVLDEVRVYRRALSQEEIEAHCANPGQAPAKDADLALHFSFNSGDAKDDSGNGNDGQPQAVEPVDGKAGKALRFTAGKKGWSRRIPVRVRAMVAAGGLLFTAGPPDVVDPDDPLGAFEGRKGGILNVIETSGGETLSETKLSSPPVFNGAAAANGRLYLSLEDGSIACYGQ